MKTITSNTKWLDDKTIGGLAVPFTVFADEWNNCYGKPAHDRTALFSMLHPVILHWIRMLQEPAFPKNVAYMSTLCRLETTNKIELMRAWGQQPDIYQELAVSYVRLLDGHCLYTSLLGEPIEKMYLLQRSHVLLLTHIIRSYKKKELRDWGLVKCKDIETYPADKSTWLNELLLDSDPYERYLISNYLVDKLDKEYNDDLRRTINAYKARIAR